MAPMRDQGPVVVTGASAGLGRAAAAVEETLGPIDVWVNNAMVSVFCPVRETTSEEYRRVTEVTYLGAVHGTDEPETPGRPDNLWAPLPGDRGAHGRFDRDARARSPQLWIATHRGWLTAAAAALAVRRADGKTRR